MYLNRVTLIGFTGQQPKTLATRTGKELTRLSVATTRRFQQDSEWKEKTQWHDCVLYGATAHFAATLPKGSHVLIEGELTYREFERTVESETGAIKVQWPVTEIVGRDGAHGGDRASAPRREIMQTSARRFALLLRFHSLYT